MIEFLMSRLGIILTSGCGNDGVEYEEGGRHRWRRASVFADILVAIKLEQSLCLFCAGTKRLIILAGNWINERPYTEPGS